MMPDTVTLNAFVSRDGQSKPTYSPTAVEYDARIELKNHLIVDKHGREVLAKGRVFLAMTTVPSVDDKLTLPAGYVPLTPPILAVNSVSDDVGSHHVVLEIG